MRQEPQPQIWARPVGATRDWSGAQYGPWALENAFGTSTRYIRADLVEELVSAGAHLAYLAELGAWESDAPKKWDDALDAFFKAAGGE